MKKDLWGPARMIRMASDLRRCASGKHCSDRVMEESRYCGAMIETEVGLCRTCTTRLGRTIGNLAADVVELNMLVGASSRMGDGRVSGTKEMPSPIRVGIFDLRTIFIETVVGAAQMVADHDGAKVNIRWPEGEFDPAIVRVKAAADFLRFRVDRLVTLSLGVALEIATLHARVRVVAGRTHLVHRLTPACPWCDQRALVRHNGSAVVECEHCGKQIDERHWSWLVHTVMAQQGA